MPQTIQSPKVGAHLMVIDATETLAEINESLIYVSETLRICKPERREAMLEMVDELLDAKNEKRME